MSRAWRVTGVALAACAFTLSGCGGSGSDSAAPAPTDPSPSATKATTPVQPQGADGVTYDIQNWDDYADDPAVLAWKKAAEAIGASGNRGKLVPGTTKVLSKSGLRAYLAGVNQQWDNGWTVKTTGDAKILSSRTDGSRARLVMCLWSPTTDFYDKSGKLVGKPTRQWNRQKATLKKTSDGYVVIAVTQKGTCSGGAPK